MNKYEAQVRACGILVDQGYSIIQIGRAFEKVEKNVHCLRHYSRNMQLADIGIMEEEQCPIDGCLVAVKIGGSVKFGFSVVHPNDRKGMAPKKVTGLIAAAKAYLSPNAAVPLKFAYMFDNEGVPNHFIERCAAYFKVRTISANVVHEVLEEVPCAPHKVPRSRKIGYKTEKVVVKC